MSECNWNNILMIYIYVDFFLYLFGTWTLFVCRIYSVYVQISTDVYDFTIVVVVFHMTKK